MHEDHEVIFEVRRGAGGKNGRALWQNTFFVERVSKSAPSNIRTTARTTWSSLTAVAMSELSGPSRPEVEAVQKLVKAMLNVVLDFISTSSRSSRASVTVWETHKGFSGQQCVPCWRRAQISVYDARVHAGGRSSVADSCQLSSTSRPCRRRSVKEKRF